MQNPSRILNIDRNSLRANLYTSNHFRMIGLIDVMMAFEQITEKVTLAFYSSSGTNNGKIKGLWYPIVGIRTASGAFTEFTPIINSILTQTTRHGRASAGWLAKSLFFSFRYLSPSKIPGFADDPYYESLLEIGKLLQTLYENGNFHLEPSLNPYSLNEVLTSPVIYPGNQRSQRENFEWFIHEIFMASL